MSLHYIIDGYNLTNHPSFTKTINKRALDSRNSLLELIRLKRLCGSKNNSVTVVFDGFPDQRQAIEESHINTIFSRNESADDKIKKIIESFGNKKNLIVVSDDNELRFIVKSSGANVLSVKEFIEPKLSRISKKEEEQIKSDLNYSQINKINQELRRVWLKE